MIVRRLLLPPPAQEHLDPEVRCRLRLLAAMEMQLPAVVAVLDRGPVGVERRRDRRRVDAARAFLSRYQPAQAVFREIGVAPYHVANGAAAFGFEIAA